MWAGSAASGSRVSEPSAARRTSSVPSTRTCPPSGKGGVPQPPGVTSSAISLPVAATRAGETTSSAIRCSASRLLANVMA